MKSAGGWVKHDPLDFDGEMFTNGIVQIKMPKLPPKYFWQIVESKVGIFPTVVLRKELPIFGSRHIASKKYLPSLIWESHNIVEDIQSLALRIVREQDIVSQEKRNRRMYEGIYTQT